MGGSETRCRSRVGTSSVTDESAQMRFVAGPGLRLIKRIFLGRIEYGRINIAVESTKRTLQPKVRNIKSVNERNGVWTNSIQELNNI